MNNELWRCAYACVFLLVTGIVIVCLYVPIFFGIRDTSEIGFLEKLDFHIEKNGINKLYPDQKGLKRYSLLHAVCRNGDLHAVRHLCSRGANLNVRDSDGCTPLISIFNRHDWVALKDDVSLDIATFLIEHGADIDLNNKNESNALHYVSDKQLRTVKYLINKKINIDKQNIAGETPVMSAVRNKNFRVVALLADSGADLNLQSIQKRTALDYAIESKNKEIVQLLRKHGAKSATELKAEADKKKQKSEPTKEPKKPAKQRTTTKPKP